MMNLKIDQSPDIWVRGVNRWATRIDGMVSDVMNERQPEIDEWMRINAPWIDRTGAARASLHSVITESIGSWMIAMTYGSEISYARYLEYDHAGKFSVLAPARDYWGPIILADIQKALR